MNAHGAIRKLFGRIGIVALSLGIAYSLAMWQPIRAWYSSVDKLAHGIVFSGVFGMLVWALPWRSSRVAILAAVLGGAVEIHQFFLPGFTPSWADWAADLCGIVLAWALLGFFSKRGGRQA